MTDLRKAAEMALESLEYYRSFEDCQPTPASKTIPALRQALAHDALDRMVAENQKLGLYDDATPEVTPEVTTQVTTQVPCKTHPDAPHGFDRNASHSADRYVCECESWEPPEEAFTLDRGCWERGCVAYDTRDGDGVIVYVDPVLKEKNT